MTVNIEKLEFTCPGLQDGGKFPPEYTGRGADTSPEFIISNLSPQGKTVAITLDDIKNQFLGILNHWVIWNIPAMAKIPGAVPAGKEVRRSAAPCRAWATAAINTQGLSRPKEQATYTGLMFTYLTAL